MELCQLHKLPEQSLGPDLFPLCSECIKSGYITQLEMMAAVIDTGKDKPSPFIQARVLDITTQQAKIAELSEDNTRLRIQNGKFLQELAKQKEQTDGVQEKEEVEEEVEEEREEDDWEDPEIKEEEEQKDGSSSTLPNAPQVD